MLKQIALAALAAALAGCAGMPFAESGAARPACDTTEFSIYFAPDSESLPWPARATLTEGLKAVDACEAQGGEFVRAVVTAYPDTAETGAAAERTALSRTETVVAALVNAGLPGERVVGVENQDTAADAVMRRRAIVRLELR